MDALSEQDAKILDLILNQDHSLSYIGDPELGETFFDENKLYIDYLASLGCINKHADHLYSIKPIGKLFIEGGGFTRAWKEKEEQLELLKSQSILTKKEIKNITYSKRISVIAILVSAIAAIFSILQYFKK